MLNLVLPKRRVGFNGAEFEVFKASVDLWYLRRRRRKRRRRRGGRIGVGGGR
jgi:hypothetical protein